MLGSSKEVLKTIDESLAIVTKLEIGTEEDFYSLISQESLSKIRESLEESVLQIKYLEVMNEESKIGT